MASGCWVARVEGPPSEDLSTWSDTPLPPDPALDAKAMEAQSSCQGSPDAGAPMRVLIQDRRTQWTAAFLMSGPGQFGSCLLTTAGGMSGGGSGPALGAMTAELTIDDRSSGDIGDGDAQELGGRVVQNAASVVVNFDGGRAVTASLRDGYWLAWWPAGPLAESVTARDGSGAAIVTIEVLP
jgi:hypothetical protein